MSAVYDIDHSVFNSFCSSCFVPDGAGARSYLFANHQERRAINTMYIYSQFQKHTIPTINQ